MTRPCLYSIVFEVEKPSSMFYCMQLYILFSGQPPFLLNCIVLGGTEAMDTAKNQTIRTLFGPESARVWFKKATWDEGA